MPRRDDISSIMIIGAGPIIIGQACEFDYSGAQACKALREEGYRIILVNSNPATIMTDPDMADATYIEPITPEIVARIVERNALMPCCQQWAGKLLNTALALHQQGVLDEFNVELIGAKPDAIKRRKTAPCSARRWILSALNQPDRAQSIILMMRWRHWKLLACQRSFAPLLRLAVKVAGWPITLRNLKISCAMVCACPLFRKSLSKNRSGLERI